MITTRKVSFRLNMKPFGVKVLCIEPGFFKTNVTDTTILSNNVRTLWGRLPQDLKDAYGTEYLQKCTSGSLLFDMRVPVYLLTLLVFPSQL